MAGAFLVGLFRGRLDGWQRGDGIGGLRQGGVRTVQGGLPQLIGLLGVHQPPRAGLLLHHVAPVRAAVATGGLALQLGCAAFGRHRFITLSGSACLMLARSIHGQPANPAKPISGPPVLGLVRPAAHAGRLQPGERRRWRWRPGLLSSAHEGTGVCGWCRPALAPARSFPPHAGGNAPCVPPGAPGVTNSPGRRGCPAGAGPATRVPGLGSEPYGRRDTLAVSDLTHSGPISPATGRGVRVSR